MSLAAFPAIVPPEQAPALPSHTDDVEKAIVAACRHFCRECAKKTRCICLRLSFRDELSASTRLTLNKNNSAIAVLFGIARQIFYFASATAPPSNANKILGEPPFKKRSAFPSLSGQLVQGHFSIEATAIATPVRTTISPRAFLTRIDAASPFLIRRAMAPTWHQIARWSDKVMTSVTPSRLDDPRQGTLHRRGSRRRGIGRRQGSSGSRLRDGNHQGTPEDLRAATDGRRCDPGLDGAAPRAQRASLQVVSVWGEPRAYRRCPGHWIGVEATALFPASRRLIR